MAVAPSIHESNPGQIPEASQSPATGWILVWACLLLSTTALPWLSGVTELGLNTAVEAGQARIETKTRGEVGDDAIRKAIHLQRSTLPFWRTLSALGDFVVDPAMIAIRALVTATLFSAFAAVSARPIEFAAAFRDCARLQYYWVLGPLLRILLIGLLHREQVGLSPSIFLSPGRHPAGLVVFLDCFDFFVIAGWIHLAFAGWSRRQANLVVSSSICVTLAIVEASVRSGWVLMIGAGMRLCLMPENMK
ncbi:MAG: hypothetical protein SFX72_19805 [Isosphaeraceae bacterium]|nr:hypothetical protein [Isosphaeraceae bacterium]